MRPTPRAGRMSPLPAWTYRYHDSVDELVHAWAGGEAGLGCACLTGDALFTLSTRGLGRVFSPDTKIVLQLEGTIMLTSRVPSCTSLVGMSDARFELAGTRDVEGCTTLVGAMEDGLLAITALAAVY